MNGNSAKAGALGALLIAGQIVVAVLAVWLVVEIVRALFRVLF